MRIKSTPVSMMSLMLAACAAAVCFKMSNATAADAAAPAAKPATYTVNISPPNKVGQKMSIVVDVDNKTNNQATITMPNAPAPQTQSQNQDVVIHLEADGEVVGVFPNGGIQKSALTVKKMTAVTNGQSAPGLPGTGAKIVAEKTGKTSSFTIDGKPASADVAALLKEVVQSDDEKHSDQEMFGSQNPVAVGATWPVNSVQLLEGMKNDFGVDLTGVSGTMKLDGITGTGDNQVAKVSGNVSFEGFKPSMPPGIMIDSTTFVSGMVYELSPTATKGGQKMIMTISIKTQAHGAMNGATMQVTSDTEQKKTTVVTFQSAQ